MAESEGWRGDGSSGDGTLDETDASRARAGYGRSSVREQTDRIKQRAREKGAQLKETAEQKAEELKERAERKADEVTSKVGERVSTLARALRRAGEGLREEGEGRFADLTDEAAAQVERFGSYLDGRKPNEMIGELERMARGNPALFVGGTFAVGLLVGRFLRAGRGGGADVVFEPEGDWTLDGDGGPGGDGRSGGGSRGRAQQGDTRATDQETAARVELAAETPHPERAMTPDLESISDLHPSEPAPGGPRERFMDETPVRTAIAGHETRGPGIRTGSSGAAALDAGSGGPRQNENDNLRTRRRGAEEEER